MAKKITKKTPRWQPADKHWKSRPLDTAAKITVLVDSNPHVGVRGGRASRAKRFVYKTGMSVEQAIKRGARPHDVRWDVLRGYIKLGK